MKGLNADRHLGQIRCKCYTSKLYYMKYQDTQLGVIWYKSIENHKYSDLE